MPARTEGEINKKGDSALCEQNDNEPVKIVNYNCKPPTTHISHQVVATIMRPALPVVSAEQVQVPRPADRAEIRDGIPAEPPRQHL